MRLRNYLKPEIVSQVIITLVVAAVVGAGVYVLTDDKKDTSQGSNTPALVKVEPSGINYPEEWRESGEIDQESKDAGVISDTSRSDPNLRVIFRRQGRAVGDSVDIKDLPDKIAAAIIQSNPNFVLVDKKVVKFGEYEAANVTYKESKEEDGILTQQFVIPTPKNSYYVVYQTDESDFKALTGDINKVNQSIAEYIKTHDN